MFSVLFIGALAARIPLIFHVYFSIDRPTARFYFASLSNANQNDENPIDFRKCHKYVVARNLISNVLRNLKSSIVSYMHAVLIATFVNVRFRLWCENYVIIAKIDFASPANILRNAIFLCASNYVDMYTVH